MMTKAPTMMALLLLSAIAATASGALTKSDILALTPEALFAYGLKGLVGGCGISLHPRSTGAYADLYVTTATIGNGYRGWPRNRNDRGTGAVKAPEFPRRRTYCWFQRSEYDLPQSLRNAFCTNSGISNAAAQLRDAAEKDQCGL